MLNLADIAGANATVPLATPNITARWISIVFSGSGTVRVGGPDTSASKGLPFPANGGSNFWPYAGPTFSYSLGQINLYLPIGATASVAYEPFD